MKRLTSLLLLTMFFFGFFVSRTEAGFSSNKRRAVVLEAFYALRPSHDGSCDRTIPSPTGEGSGRCISTWNYLASDAYAYSVVKGWYQHDCDSSEWSMPGDGSNCRNSYPFSFYNNVYGYGYSNGPYGFVGRGGQCKFFANLVLYRSGAHQGRIPTYDELPSQGESNLTLVRPGDVLFRPHFHIAIVVEVKRNSSGAVTGLDVIDSNWISDNGLQSREVIGRHLYPIQEVQDKYMLWKGAFYFNTDYDPNQ